MKVRDLIPLLSEQDADADVYLHCPTGGYMQASSVDVYLDDEDEGVCIQ